MDLYVFERALGSAHPKTAEQFLTAVLDSYRTDAANAKEIFQRLSAGQSRACNSPREIIWRGDRPFLEENLSLPLVRCSEGARPKAFDGGMKGACGKEPDGLSAKVVGLRPCPAAAGGAEAKGVARGFLACSLPTPSTPRVRGSPIAFPAPPYTCRAEDFPFLSKRPSKRPPRRAEAAGLGKGAAPSLPWARASKPQGTHRAERRE